MTFNKRPFDFFWYTVNNSVTKHVLLSKIEQNLVVAPITVETVTTVEK